MPPCLITAPRRRPRVRRGDVFVALIAGLVALVGLAGTVGCASYTDEIRESRQAVSNNDPERAIGHINEQLGVDELDGRPADLEDENALLLLERATLLQAMGHYESASRDKITVDDRLELLDISGETADNIVRFVYSDDAGPYRAPPHERLLLNTMNMLNFLALGDTSSARVEARRFNILQQFFVDEQAAELIPDILGLGNYMAGVAFEAARDYGTAARYYVLARLYGTWPERTEDRLLDIIAVSGYRGAGLGHLREEADELLERAGQRPRIDRSEYHRTYQRGDTLVVVQTGMAPYREARRISLAEALTYSDHSPYASIHLTTQSRDQAMALYSSGLVTWMNTTRLTREGLASAPSSVRLDLEDRSLSLTDPIDIGEQVEEAWELVRSTALAAAISRAVARAAAGTLTKSLVEAAAREAGGDEELSRAVGWLAGLILSATLSARDTPDTRSWTTLPDNIHLVRTQLEPGPREIGIRLRGRTDGRELTVEPQRLNVVNFSRIR